MRAFFEKNTSIVAALAYLVIAVLALRAALFSDGSIGFLHDWGFPIYPEQSGQFLVAAFSTWNPAALGSYSFATDAAFKLILGFLSLPSTSFWIKMSLVPILFVAGFSMYWLVKNYFECTAVAAAFAGLFYMLTPVMFTRVIVGYYYYLIGYALLPLIFFLFVYGVKNKSYPYLILCGILFGFAAMQIQFAVLVPVLLVLFILFHRENLLRSIGAFCLVAGVFCLVQFPLVVYYLSSVLMPESSFTALASSAQYFWLFFYPPQLSDALMLFGKDYEFLFLQYFQNKILFLPFLASALLIPVIAFSIFRIKKALPFIVLGILAVILMLGTNPPFGIIYQWAYAKIPLAGLFRTSYHWAVLLAFAYAVLLGLAYDHIVSLLGEKEKLFSWVRDALIVAGCVFLVYVAYMASHLPSLAASLQKRGLPPGIIWVGIGICIAVLVLLYLKPDLFLSWISRQPTWQKYCRQIFCLLILVMILVYAWPFFTGNFTGRLQVYSPDPEYHTLYTSFQQEPGDFRILWLPMISPIQYEGYEYPGHDPLIGYSPKQSFPQAITMFNRGAQYTAYVANLQYTTDTEYFGDILSEFSTKYVINRNDFTPVLPGYLPFGNVTGFAWNNSAPTSFLQYQKDLTNAINGRNYSVWENKVTPRISPQIPVAVAGDLSTTIGLSYARQILGYSQLPAALYVEETNDYQDVTKTVVVDGGRTDDLLFSSIPSRYLSDAGWYTQDIDARTGWTTTFNWWWYDTTMSAQPEYGAFTLTSNSTLTVNPKLPSGNYTVFIKARSGPDSTNLTCTLDSVSRNLSLPQDEDAYAWYSLGRYPLTHTSMTIRSGGRAEIDAVAFVPDSELMNAETEVARYLANQSVVVIYEPENFNQTYSKHAFGTSRGYLELPGQTPVAFSLSIPKSTEYSGYVRVRASNSSSARITIDNTTYQPQIPSSGEFEWVSLGNMTLSRGNHTFAIVSPEPLGFDMVLLKSADYQYTVPNVSVTYAQAPFATWADPTRFSVTSNATGPYFLVFNENYDFGWKLTDASGYEFDHVPVNYYANGYFVNATGNTTLNLEFVRQPLYLDSVIVSLVGLAVLILVVAIGFWHRKKLPR